MVYDELEQYDDAVAAFKKSIALKPTGEVSDAALKRISEIENAAAVQGEAEAYCKQAEAHYLADRYEDAIAAYKKYLSIEPDDYEAYNHMAHAYRNLKQYPDAITAYKKAISIKPDFAEAYFGLGFLYKKTLQYTEALAAYKKVIAIEQIGDKADYARKKISELSTTTQPANK